MEKIWDVIIIGSGPAALTAAIYTTRGAASTVIIGGYTWGGQLMLTTTVDNYPGFDQGVQGPELMEKMKTQATRFGGQFEQVDATEVDFSTRPFAVKAGDKEFKGKSVIIATGAETLWLGVPGEEKLMGRGVSSCAPCDAPFYKDKKVAVVGGGDSAMEEALVLTKYATEVTIVHRRDAFKASQAMQQKVLNNPKIKVIWNSEVVELKGESKLESIDIKNNNDNQVQNIAIDGIFVAIGHSPTTKLFADKIDLDEKGYVKVMDHTKTSVDGVFVAGDVHDYHYKQAVTAAAYGCMAALDTLKYLDNKK